MRWALRSSSRSISIPPPLGSGPGTREALNKAWYRTVKSWDELEPPRYGTILTFTDYIDWKEFITDKLAEDLAAKAAGVRAVLPGSVVTSHSAGRGMLT